MSSKTYISKMKKIKYIVIFDNNQDPLYINDLKINKIIDVQNYIILYQINQYGFSFFFNIPFRDIHKKYDEYFKKKIFLIMK
jgi:hypothetical protein